MYNADSNARIPVVKSCVYVRACACSCIFVSKCPKIEPLSLSVQLIFRLLFPSPSSILLLLTLHPVTHPPPPLLQAPPTHVPHVRPQTNVSQTPDRDLPEWLRDAMADDDATATALSEAMREQQVQEADLEFFNEEALKEAGVAKAISRAKVLRRIRDHFK